MPARKPVEEDLPDRELIVVKDNGKVLRITIPHYAKTTYSPFSPPRAPNGHGFNPVGTLRVYGKTKEQTLACIPHVNWFADADLDVTEIDPSVMGIPVDSKPNADSSGKAPRGGVVMMSSMLEEDPPF